MKEREVFGIKFKSLRDYVTLLGYNKFLTITMINKQYGGLENLAKRKLKIENPDLVRQKLLELLAQKDQKNFYGVSDSNTNADKIAAAFIRSKLIDISENELANVARLLGISISNTEIQDIKKLLKDFSLNFQADDMKIALR